MDAEAKAIYVKHGYYTTKLRTSDGRVHDKVNIVAVNTQTCYNVNYYLWVNRNDPGQELAWLEQTLREIESRNESVIILGHVPPGSNDCLYQWAVRYRALCTQ